jgi:hypothetical protein
MIDLDFETVYLLLIAFFSGLSLWVALSIVINSGVAGIIVIGLSVLTAFAFFSD